MQPRPYIFSMLFAALVFLTSCDKGYQVRFANYYVESMDSVVVGNNKLVFKNIARNSTTEYQSISKGKYVVTCISQAKKKFITSLDIPSSGTGKRTVQIDGISQFSVLEQ